MLRRRTRHNNAPFSAVREVTLSVGVKRDHRGKKNGSPTYPENEQRKQRLVTWSGQGQTQSPTCSIRGSTCRSSSVQNRWPTSPDDSRQRCCEAPSKCWNPLAYPTIQFRHITSSSSPILAMRLRGHTRPGRGDRAGARGRQAGVDRGTARNVLPELGRTRRSGVESR